MLSFKIKKLGDYWYPDIPHEANYIYTFDKKCNKLFNRIDNGYGELTIEFEEIGIIFDGLNILYFEEQDITKYLMTDDDFNLHFMINNHIFEISSDFYWLLEHNFNFNFHKESYRIHVY